MNNLRSRFSLAVLAATILWLFQIVPSALAQDRGDYQDPPARAGRIGYVQGSVSFQPDGQGDWLEAAPNRPLTTGDNLWADRDSRAEVQIGSTSIRLSSETSLTFLDLDSDVTQLRLAMGSVFFRIRHLGSDDTFEVDTPNLAFNVTQPGEYRVDVNGNGDSTIATVRRGEGVITGGGSSYRLYSGQAGTFTGTDQLRYDVAGIGERDAFDDWSRSRDDREDHIRSTQYVPAEMTGYEDLDEYGRWHYEGDYGYVWTPVGVPYGWAPYRYGHWVYVSPWGWTWVEDEPWGFAPFHYGRWAFVGGGWCWVPGPVAVAPVYSPALVAFVGGGGGFSIGVGVGVGWFPLAPGEVFVPWYRTSPRYVQNVNITNTHVTNVQVTNVYNNVTVNHVTNVTYVNQRVNNSVTVVNRETFVNARPVANNIVKVDARQMSAAPVTHEFVRNIQPERQSVVGPTRTVKAEPPQQAMARSVVATRQPAVVNRPAPPVAGFQKPAQMPQVRTVRPVAVSEAKPLERGAQGVSANAPGRPANANNPGNARPGEMTPRPGMPQNAQQPNAPMNQPRNNQTPRPGNPENPAQGRQNTPEPGRPNTPEAGRQNTPEPGRPNTPEAGRPKEAGRPNNPDNGRPSREVPRPPSRGEQTPVQTEQPKTNPNTQRPDMTRPENRQPETQQPQNSRPMEQNRPETRQPEQKPMEQNRPETRQPEQRPMQQNPPESRRPETPQSQPEQAPRPDNRNETVPQPQSRQQSVPRPGNQPEQPQSRPQGNHNESPRPPQNNKENDKNDKNKDQQKFR